MNDLRECVLCGRQGVRDFEPAEAQRWRCTSREACQRRQDDARAEQLPGTDEAIAATDSPDPSAALAGIARELETLRNIAEAVPSLFKQVEDLARVVQDLAGQLATYPAGGVVPSWLDLPEDATTACTVLQDLTGWMREVFLRYPDAAAVLPPCWMWHPDVVEELLWLMYAWLAAYRDEDATVARAGDWHDRYRPGVVKRIKTQAGACSLENHQERGSRHAAAAPVPLADALEPIAAWWATRRSEVAPEPTEDQLAAAAFTHRRPAGGRR